MWEDVEASKQASSGQKDRILPMVVISVAHFAWDQSNSLPPAWVHIHRPV